MSDYNFDDYEITCTSQWFKYGNNFNKTYLYENKNDSIFLKITLTLKFNNDSDPISDRYYKIYKIPNYNINKPKNT